MMSLLKSILDFYIRSSLHVAVCFVALFKVVSIIATIWIPNSVFLIAFCAIVIGYNLIKYSHLLRKGVTFKFKYPIAFLTTACLFMSFYYLIKENHKVWILLVIVSLISFFYSFPLKNNRTLRHFPSLKLFSVVLCWMLLLFALPSFSSFSALAILTDSSDFNNQVYLTRMLSVFLFVYALCIPFEIRDLRYDDIHLQTLPQKIGVNKTKILGIVLLIFSLIVYEFGDFHPYFNPELNIDFAFIIIVIITAIAIWFSDKFKSDYYASFFVEAIPVLWLGLYCIL